MFVITMFFGAKFVHYAEKLVRFLFSGFGMDPEKVSQNSDYSHIEGKIFYVFTILFIVVKHFDAIHIGMYYFSLDYLNLLPFV